MVFTSVSFLVYFLPIVFGIYYLVPRKYRNIRNFILLLASLVFYFIGEPKAIIWMILSIIMNYIFGLIIGRSSKNRIKNVVLFLAVVGNLSILAYFKYMNFFIENIANLLSLNVSLKDVIMPIGISFYTFQGMSYVIDVYRGIVDYQKNLFSVGLYISLFPQLIAGPIVRYETVADQIDNRIENVYKIFRGVARFIVGLGKKMLLANKFGIIADEIYDLNASSDLGIVLSWFGAFVYTLQIFYDFSGYSDMAIGLGKIFGFEFEENFNYPLISKSITEFWSRWHISLGTWFRDYVYIPLGGNRVSKSRHIFNILVVWILTGFWHGASWNYVYWGLYSAIILIIEKFLIADIHKRAPEIFKHIYAMIFILIGMTIFKNEDIGLLVGYLQNMVGFRGLGSIKDIYFYLRQYYPELIFGILFSTPIFKKFERGYPNWIYIILYIVLFILSFISILASSFNPFIYFRF